MSLSKAYKTFPEIENAGITIELAKNDDGSMASVLIARTGKSNKAYQVALAAAFKPHARAQKLGTLSDEVAESVYRDVWIRTILKGWSFVPMSDVTGNEADEGYADFSHENAKLLFDNLPELYDDLVDKSGMQSLFREQALEEDAKN